jgi:cell division protein FtsB
MRKPRLWQWMQNLLHEKQHRLVMAGGVGCFLLLSMLAMVGERGFFEVYKYNLYLDRVEERIRILEEENERLQLQVAGLRSDPYQVEKLAREDLGMVRPDEVIFEIIDGRPQDFPSLRGQRKEDRGDAVVRGGR